MNQTVKDYVEKSHMETAKVISNMMGDLTKKLDQVASYQKEQNGRTARHTEQIMALENAFNVKTAEIKMAGRTASYIMGAMGIVFLGLVSLIYSLSMSSIKENINATNANVTANSASISEIRTSVSDILKAMAKISNVQAQHN